MVPTLGLTWIAEARKRRKEEKERGMIGMEYWKNSSGGVAHHPMVRSPQASASAHGEVLQSQNPKSNHGKSLSIYPIWSMSSFTYYIGTLY